jgi:hypothetical protein
MKRLFMASLIGFALVLTGYPALAGGKYHKGHYYGHQSYKGHFKGYRGHHYRHGRGHHYGDEILIGAGIIGGSILLGSLLSQPSYSPAPTYYAPPRAPVCQRDQVYRYLPDGSVQWGTRTRCY